MSTEHTGRPSEGGHSKDEKTTEPHPRTYTRWEPARWVEAAPPTATWEEVAEACDKYETPEDAWPNGNRRIDDFQQGDGQ